MRLGGSSISPTASPGGDIVKIAYLTSRYPAVSHTFILREVCELRKRGISIGTFSARRADRSDIQGTRAEREARTTRWLVPPPFGPVCRAFAWALLTRPSRLCQTFWAACTQHGIGFCQHLKWFAYFGEAVLLAHWLIHDQYERLHCHFGNSGSSTGMLAARLAGIPFSFTCHGSELLEPVKFCLAEKIDEARFVACVSEYGRRQLKSICSSEHLPKLHQVPCGLTDDEIPTIHEDGCPSKILCVGRLSPEKGHLVLLSALSALRDRGISFHCTLAGEGPERTRIGRRLQELGLTDSIKLVGSLSPDRVAELYQSAGVVVLASLIEGVPVVLMEALAHSRPVVATRVGGIPELIEDGVTGLLVDPDDMAGLADALSRVIQDPSWARRLGENGRAFVQQRYRLEKSVQTLIELFQNS